MTHKVAVTRAEIDRDIALLDEAKALVSKMRFGRKMLHRMGCLNDWLKTQMRGKRK